MKTFRALAALAVVTAGTVVATAGPAAAKGPESVTLTGPGIDGTVVVGGWGAADQDASTDFPAYLHLALTQFTDGLLFETDVIGTPEPQPSGGEDLGAKYTLTWTMSSASSADPAANVIVQELYPEAASDRSYIRTLANRFTDSPDRWVEVDPILGDILDAYNAVPAAETVAAETSTSASTDEPSSGLHPLATLAAATTTFAAGLALGRRRRGRGRARWPWATEPAT
jgi:hypothetical protein